MNWSGAINWIFQTTGLHLWQGAHSLWGVSSQRLTVPPSLQPLRKGLQLALEGIKHTVCFNLSFGQNISSTHGSHPFLAYYSSPFPKDNHCQYLNVYSNFPVFLYVGVCVCVCVCKHKWLCMIAAAAKSLQLCPTLCDPIDGSPVPGIPQARTLEWLLYKLFSTWSYLTICLEHLSVSVHESLLHDFNICREIFCSRIYLATLLLMYIYEFPNPLRFCYYQPGYNNYCCIYIFCTQASISLGWVSGSKIAGVKGMHI